MSLIALTPRLLDSAPALEQQHLQVAPRNALAFLRFGSGLRHGPAINTALLKGASDIGAGRVHPKGGFVRLVHASTFVPAQWGTQWGMRFQIPIEAPMEQLQLPLLGRLDAASVVPIQYVQRCRTYREAVRMCFALRRVHNLTQRLLACQAGLRPQLISDYLNADDKPQRKDLPAERIAAFEEILGNTLITQWLAAQSKLTVLEELTATRNVA